jgi:hypothetical protein
MSTKAGFFMFAVLVTGIPCLAQKSLPDPGVAVDPPSICDAVPGNLVTNCGFEANNSGAPTGWSMVAGFSGAGSGAGSANSGNNFFFGGNVGGDGTLTQTIPTVAGQTYKVSFYFEPDGGAPSDFSASFNGVQLYSVTNPAASGYQFLTFTATATGSSTQLEFSFRDDPGYLLLDDVVVTAVPSPYQVSYVSNLAAGDSFVNITNAGTSGAGLQSGTTANITGALCANVYAFTPDEQMVSCCSCPVTPNGLVSLSAKNDLAGNTLTPAIPTALVVKILATLPTTAGGTAGQVGCNNSAATVGTTATLALGLKSFGTTLHATPAAGTYGVTESPYSTATLSAGEVSRLGTLCNFIIANGSGYGICRTCRLGGLGAERQ